MSLKDTVIEEGLICFDEEKNFITYIHQNKKRNYNNPKDKVQVETFLTLVLNYGYPANRKQQFVSVQMGSETKESDIAFYSDDDCHETYILVECKKEDLTDQLLNIAVDQAYTYPVAVVAKYVLATSRIKNKYDEVRNKKPKSGIKIPDIPQFVINKRKYSIKG